MGLEELLQSVRARKATGEDIGLALPYLAGIVPCLGHEQCQAQMLQAGTAADWHKAIREAENQLVYRTPEMVPESGIRRAADQTLHQFGEKKFSEVSQGACMDFEGVITSRRRDRDRDILEAEGAQPDEKMPLLWQHIPMMPCGKLVAITGRSRNRVIGHFAIVDSELGRDAAQLVEFGALRLSHGFIPLEFEPLPREEDDTEFAFSGWHVFSFKIVETSLVSVPSNEDAVITANSRGKLFHPLVKGWAQAMRKALPTVVHIDHPFQAGTPAVGAGPVGKRIEIQLALPDPPAAGNGTGGTGGTGGGHKCGCGGAVKNDAPPEGYKDMEEFLAATEEWAYSS